MSAQLPETRCKHLAQFIRPRAAYIEQFCPSVNRISIRREDWNLLRKEVAAARAQGFIVDDTVRVYGSIRQTNLAEIDAEMVRDTNF